MFRQWSYPSSIEKHYIGPVWLRLQLRLLARKNRKSNQTDGFFLPFFSETASSYNVQKPEVESPPRGASVASRNIHSEFTPIPNLPPKFGGNYPPIAIE